MKQNLQSTWDVEKDLPGSEPARQLGIRSYVSVPLFGADHELMGTLCGASGRSTRVPQHAIETMGMLARLIADQWERDRAHDQALRRADDAEKRMRERAAFLAVAEHKLKTPLAVLRGWSEILADSWEDVPDDVRAEALNDMRDSSRAAMQQVHELLEEARSEVLSSQLEPVLIELNPLIHQVARQLQAASSARHQVSARSGIEAAVVADRQAVWQVLWHLGENAIKYSPDGGRIDLDIRAIDDNRVVLTVADEGMGVSDDVDLFAPFTRGTGEGIAGINGTGLGLHIVHKLVQAMNGTVSAERRSDRGSIFSVILPLA